MRNNRYYVFLLVLFVLTTLNPCILATCRTILRVSYSKSGLYSELGKDVSTGFTRAKSALEWHPV